jgi:hypothetical protein
MPDGCVGRVRTTHVEPTGQHHQDRHPAVFALGSLEQHTEELRCENTILCSGTLPPLDQDHELRVVYYRLSEAEHGWHYFC